MARPGRKPTPVNLRVLRGDAAEHEANQIKPLDIRPECPEWLSDAAKAEWNRIIGELTRLKLVSMMDQSTLAGYCQAVAEIQWATKELDEKGRIVTLRNGRKIPNPAVVMQRSAWKAIQQFAALFGMDPASRARIKLPTVGTDEASELEAFLSNVQTG